MERSQLLSVVLVGVSGMTASAESNINTDHKFAWDENIGWTNWRDADEAGQGVVVSATFLSGHIWGENVGWLNVGNGPVDGQAYANIDGTDFGVNVDVNTGDLSGYAWAENVGWLNCDTSSLGPERSRFDLVERRFRGYVWSENVGWVNLHDSTHFVATMNRDAIPTMSDWGLIAMTLLMLTVGTVVFRVRHANGTETAALSM